jgi:hypothetical protein
MIRSAITLTVLLWATAAHADWQYVKWGMTKKAAVDASNGEARFLKPGDDVVCAFTTQTPFAMISKKSIGGFDFEVTFCTEGATDRVTSVALSPASGTNLPTLKRTLISQYGQPTTMGNTSIWNDSTTGNTISYYDIGGVVGRIEYKKSGGTGL